jgi:hypothetical protein
MNLEVRMTRVCAAAALLAAGAMVPAITAAQKMTPEELVKLHIQGLTAGVVAPPEQAREVKGTVSAITPARAAGLLPGTFTLSSGATGSRLIMRFDTDRYEGEAFTLERGKVDIANADPRNGSRSAIGNFLARNLVIVSEGLLGGTLNTRWPLLDVAGRRPRMNYDGLKTLGGRDLHRLRYRAKDNQGSLEVELYFDPATYRHVASVYSSSQAQALGATIESSSQQSDQYYRIEERFGRFEQIGTLTLPKSWSIRFERAGNTANEWKYDLTVQAIEATGPKGSQPGAPLFSDPRAVTP